MTWIKSPVAIIVATQLLSTRGDLIARADMRHHPFCLSTFLSGWFMRYFRIRQVAMFGQLYVFSALRLGKTMALFGAASIVVVNVLGILVLGEILSTQANLAIGLVVLGFVVLSMSPEYLYHMPGVSPRISDPSIRSCQIRIPRTVDIQGSFPEAATLGNQEAARGRQHKHR